MDELGELEPLVYTFFELIKSVEGYKNNSTDLNGDRFVEEITKRCKRILPLQYRVMVKLVGMLPVDQTIDIFANLAKEVFKAEYNECKTTKDAFVKILGKYLKG